MGKKILNIAQREVAAVIGAAYVNVGAVTDHPLRQFLIQNFTDGYVQVSLDGGSSDAFVLGPNLSFISDVMSNSKHRGQGEDGPYLGSGVQIQVKDLAGFTAATTRKVFFSGFYEKGE